MKILFHVGVGNKDRPQRWGFVNGLFSDLARSLEKLGHDCLLYVHPRAANNKIYHKHIISGVVNSMDYNPDWVFTWNGNSEGDKQIINKYGNSKMIYGELGFFDHYKTCHFDFAGVNGNSRNLIESLSDDFNERQYKELINKYKKPRLFKDNYIFIPLQDERDTQIRLYSPFKKMNDLLGYVENLYSKSNIKILYKNHPQYKSKIGDRHNFIEVTENVHHYIPYADKVIGINSTVLFETLLYHGNLISIGLGISSRNFNSDLERKKYVLHLYNKQFYWPELSNVDKIKNSYFYKEMIR